LSRAMRAAASHLARAARRRAAAAPSTAASAAAIAAPSAAHVRSARRRAWRACRGGAVAARSCHTHRSRATATHIG
jgi:hypothetical protein